MEDKDLPRRVGLFPATSIVIANMIGAGIFTTSGLLIAELNSPLIMLALWVTGGVIALCGALSYSELGAAMPGSGGEYLFLSRLFHPIFGFLSGWVSFVVGFSAPVAASAIGFSEYLFRAFPHITDIFSKAGLYEPAGIKRAVAVFVILLFTAVHYRGIKTGVFIQNILTILKISLIVFLVAAGFLSGKGEMSHFISSGSTAGGFPGLKAAGLSLMWIMFAYSGWNASTYLGAEIKNPSRVLPRSLLSGTLIVIILYLSINILYVYATNPAEMKGVISVGGLAMGKLFGGRAEAMFSLMIGFALFSSLSAFIIIGPRVYYSMARDGLFFKSVGRIHPKFGVPSNSILLQGVIAIILALSGTFEQILTYMGFALGIFPLLTVLSVIKLRRTDFAAHRMPGYPFTQIFYLTAGLLILILSFLERPVESAIAIVTVIAGIPAYFLFKRSST